MDFLRRNLFFVICAVVGGGGIALGVVGLQRMPRVQEEMQKVGNVYRGVTGLKPISLSSIEAQRKRIDTLVNDRREVFAKAKQMYGYTLLVPNVLPNGDAIATTEFRRAYREAMNKLFDSLKSKSPPTAYDFNFWQNEIENEKAEVAEQRRQRGAPTAIDVSPEKMRTAGGVLSKDGARFDPESRAAMAVAQRAFCYAVPFGDEKRSASEVPSLDFLRAMDEAKNLEAPELESVWYAQVGYWIQKDVVNAVVAVNEEAAAELDKEHKFAWVGTLPIKDVLSIRVLEGFVPRDGEETYGDGPEVPEPRPPGTPETAFTHSGSTDWYDVVQFTVKLVMDARDLPKFIEKLTSDSFHTLLRVSYAEVPPNRNVRGKIYGSEPTVTVVMDFETILLGEVFRQYMPDSVCEYFGINCPARDDEEGN